jgi:hypothetical protein
MAADSPQSTPLGTLLTLMLDVEAGDPLDFGGLSLDEDDARRLVALSMLKMQADLDALDINPAERELVLMAAAAHLVLENLLIHVKYLQETGASGQQTMRALLARLRASGGQ